MRGVVKVFCCVYLIVVTDVGDLPDKSRTKSLLCFTDYWKAVPFKCYKNNSLVIAGSHFDAFQLPTLPLLICKSHDHMVYIGSQGSIFSKFRHKNKERNLGFYLLLSMEKQNIQHEEIVLNNLNPKKNKLNQVSGKAKGGF